MRSSFDKTRHPELDRLSDPGRTEWLRINTETTKELDALKVNQADRREAECAKALKKAVADKPSHDFLPPGASNIKSNKEKLDHAAKIVKEKFAAERQDILDKDRRQKQELADRDPGRAEATAEQEAASGQNRDREGQDAPDIAVPAMHPDMSIESAQTDRPDATGLSHPDMPDHGPDSGLGR